MHRTLLFVPGDRPDRIAKALASAADAVVIDLEDAVSPAAKVAARIQVTDALEANAPAPSRVLVRVNAVDTAWFAGDLDALLGSRACEHVGSVVLPKTQRAADVLHLDASLAAHEDAAGERPSTTRIGIVPILETAAGILAGPAIAAASSRVRALMFGAADLSAELGIETTAEGTEFLHARSHVVLAATSCGIPAIDGPYLRLDDETGLATAATAARRLGFRGKAAIHPTQLVTIAARFAPTEEQCRWAVNVVEAFAAAEARGSGAIRLEDGTFVDQAVVDNARRVLADAGAAGDSA